MWTWLLDMVSNLLGRPWQALGITTEAGASAKRSSRRGTYTWYIR